MHPYPYEGVTTRLDEPYDSSTSYTLPIPDRRPIILVDVYALWDVIDRAAPFVAVGVVAFILGAVYTAWRWIPGFAERLVGVLIVAAVIWIVMGRARE